MSIYEGKDLVKEKIRIARPCFFLRIPLKLLLLTIGKSMEIYPIKSPTPLLLHFKIQEQKVMKAIQKNIRRLIEAEKKALEEYKRDFNKRIICTLSTH